MARKHRKWVKLWSHWYTRLDHLGLSADALALGGPLMILSDASWDMKTGTAKVPSIEALCRLTRAEVSATATAMEELISAGTLEREADGSITWPDYGEEQETAQAARTRRYRVKGVTVTTQNENSDGVGDGNSHASVTTEERGKRREVRGKKLDVEEQLQVGEPPAVPPKSKPPQFHPDTDKALEMLNTCRKTAAEVNSKKGVRAIKGKAIKQAISARLNEDCGLDGVARVLEWHLHEDSRFREGLDDFKSTPPVDHLLKATSVFREGNFNKRLAAGDVPAPGEEHRPPLDVTGYSPLAEGDWDDNENYGPQDMS